MARRWAGRAFFPITFLVILFMPIFVWSPQTKGHVLRLRLSNDPSANIEAFFSLTSSFSYSTLRFNRAHLSSIILSDHIQFRGT